MAIGLYVHIPFCGQKCPYCDFYSAVPAKHTLDIYTDVLERQLYAFSGKNISADTLYFGGGTPNLLGGERLSRLIDAAKAGFSLPEDSEITVEANPSTTTGAFLDTIRKSGANRLSLGLQSAEERELRFLGRRHTPEQCAKVIRDARSAGFSHISLDLMLAVPGQTKDSLHRSIAFCLSQDIEHLSAYLLKIEPGTPFYRQKDTLFLPDEDETADLYSQLVTELAEAGYRQYEISNFAKAGFQGRHNLKYWHGEEYLGFGPSAHSFHGGKRFYYPRSLDDYLLGKPPIDDGDGGSREEVAMLQLRLTEGLSDAMWRSRFGEPLPGALLQRAKQYEKAGLIQFDSPTSFHLTPDGFLVSNLLIGELLEALGN